MCASGPAFRVRPGSGIGVGGLGPGLTGCHRGHDAGLLRGDWGERPVASTPLTVIPGRADPGPRPGRRLPLPLGPATGSW